MRLFVSVLALLGTFFYLLVHFSFWAAFGAMYMVGMVIVALVAGFGRHQASTRLAWDDSAEIDPVH